jgi:hypothetical protein
VLVPLDATIVGQRRSADGEPLLLLGHERLTPRGLSVTVPHRDFVVDGARWIFDL